MSTIPSTNKKQNLLLIYLKQHITELLLVLLLLSSIGYLLYTSIVTTKEIQQKNIEVINNFGTILSKYMKAIINSYQKSPYYYDYYPLVTDNAGVIDPVYRNGIDSNIISTGGNLCNLVHQKACFLKFNDKPYILFIYPLYANKTSSKYEIICKINKNLLDNLANFKNFNLKDYIKIHYKTVNDTWEENNSNKRFNSIQCRLYDINTMMYKPINLFNLDNKPRNKNVDKGN